MLRSSASINDGCTIIWDHQVAGKQFDKKLNRKTRSKACSQQSLIFLENQAKICTILLWWWICLQEKSWLYTNICRMNHVMAFQGVVVSPWFHFFLLNYCYSSAMNQHYYNSITFSSHPKGKNAQQPTNGSSIGGETSPDGICSKNFHCVKFLQGVLQVAFSRNLCREKIKSCF